MTVSDTDIPDDLREPLLAAALPHVVFEGWTARLLSIAAQDVGCDPGLADLAFPDGVRGLIALHATLQDQKMVESCPETVLDPLKIREKITLLVRRRIEAEQPTRDAARQSLAHLALPGNQGLGLRILYRTVDLMWKTIRDTSTDFNFYSKRLTLAAVYSATFFFWLNDESENYTESWAFLDRRIDDVMGIEKTKARIRGVFRAECAKRASPIVPNRDDRHIRWPKLSEFFTIC